MLARSADALAPLGIVAFAIAVLSVMDAVVKNLTASLPVAQIVTLRYFFGALVALPFFLAARPRITRRSLAGNALRGLVMLVTATCFFHALATLPLAETLALSYCAPLFMAVLGVFILGERVSREVGLGILIGFCGVLVILSSKFAGEVTLDPRTLSGILAALAAAFFYALAMVLLRRQSAFDSSAVMVFMQAAFAAALASPSLLVEAAPLDGALLATLVLIGALGTVGHFGLAWGYARAEAARLGPLEYTSFLWASTIGYMIFNEPLAPETAFGAVLIIAACVVAGRRRAPQTELSA